MPKEKLKAEDNDEELEDEVEDEEVDEKEEKETEKKADTPTQVPTLFLSHEYTGAVLAVVTYLKEYAEKDPLFKTKLEASTQTEKDLLNYLSSEAKKKAANGVSMITDSEVYAWSVHFIDENIKDVKSAGLKAIEKPKEVAEKPKVVKKEKVVVEKPKVVKKEKKVKAFTPRPTGLADGPTLFDFSVENNG